MLNVPPQAFTATAAYQSIDDVWQREGRDLSNLINFLAGLTNYLLRQKSGAVITELDDRLVFVDREIVKMNLLRNAPMMERAQDVLRQTALFVSESRERNTRAQYVTDEMQQEFERRLTIYNKRFVAEQYASIVSDHLAMLQAAQELLVQAKDAHQMTIEDRLDALQIRLRIAQEQRARDLRGEALEQQRRQFVGAEEPQFLPPPAPAPALTPSAAPPSSSPPSTTNERLLEKAAQFNSTSVTVIDASTSKIKGMVRDLEYDDDDDLPPLVDVELPDTKPPEKPKPIPTQTKQPPSTAALEDAVVNDIGAWVRGFRGALPPWQVVEFFTSPLVSDDDKMKRIGQLVAYCRSVERLYRGGDRPIFSRLVEESERDQDIEQFEFDSGATFLDLVDMRIEEGETGFAEKMLGHLAGVHRSVYGDSSELPNLRAGEQLKVLPTLQRHASIRDEVQRFINAFIAEAKYQRLDNAYVLGPVLTNMRLCDNAADSAFKTLRFGVDDGTDAAAKQEAVEMLQSQCSTILELSRGMLNNIASPIEEARRNLTDGTYRTAHGGDNSRAVLWSECDATAIDESLAGQRVRVYYYQAPSSSNAPERQAREQAEIDDLLASLRGNTQPYRTFCSLQDSMLDAGFDVATSPLITQSCQHVQTSEWSRMQMFDLRSRTSIAVVLLGMTGSLTQELLRVPMSNVVSAGALLPPTPAFTPQTSTLAYLNESRVNVTTDRVLAPVDRKIFLDNAMHYLLTEQQPEEFTTRTPEATAPIVEQTAKQQRNDQQSYISRFLGFLGDSPSYAAGIARAAVDIGRTAIYNEARALYEDSYHSSHSDKFTILYMFLRAANKLLFSYGHLIAAWSAATLVSTRVKRTILQYCQTVSSADAAGVVATTLRTISVALAQNGVTDNKVWQSMAVAYRAVINMFSGIAAYTAPGFNALWIGPLLGALRDQLRALGASVGGFAATVIDTVLIAIREKSIQLARHISFFGITERVANRRLRMIQRAQYAIDALALMFGVGSLLLAGYTGGLRYFAIELTNQIVTGLSQLILARYANRIVAATPRNYRAAVAALVAGGMMSTALAPWLLGTEYTVYGIFKPTVDRVLLYPFLDSPEMAARNEDARLYAVMAARSLSMIYLNMTREQAEETDGGGVPFEELSIGLVRGAAAWLRDFTHSLWQPIEGAPRRRKPNAGFAAVNYLSDVDLRVNATTSSSSTSTSSRDETPVLTDYLNEHISFLGAKPLTTEQADVLRSQELAASRSLQQETQAARMAVRSILKKKKDRVERRIVDTTTGGGSSSSSTSSEEEKPRVISFRDTLEFEPQTAYVPRTTPAVVQALRREQQTSPPTTPAATADDSTVDNFKTLALQLLAMMYRVGKLDRDPSRVAVMEAVDVNLPQIASFLKGYVLQPGKAEAIEALFKQQLFGTPSERYIKALELYWNAGNERDFDKLARYITRSTRPVGSAREFVSIYKAPIETLTARFATMS